MTESADHTLRLLYELRAATIASDSKFDDRHGSLESKIDRNHEDLKKRMDSLRQAINGESVLRCYAAAKVKERLTAIEERISALENRS